jgi:glutamate 5-kinase
VINENDTTATDEITFGDNDFLSAQVAIMIEARALILLTNTDGLFTSDPGSDPDAELIDEVSDFSALESFEIGMHTSKFGSGGMRSKVVAAEMASGSGIPVTICNGTVPGSLRRAAGGERIGTRVVPHTHRAPSFKLWLRHAAPARGRIEVDDGAARMLREGGASLLPVGVFAVAGEFAAGDPVEVTNGGEVVGKGVAEHSAAVIERLRGKKSSEVVELIGDGAEEAVHRDRFVLL